MPIPKPTVQADMPRGAPAKANAAQRAQQPRGLMDMIGGALGGIGNFAQEAWNDPRRKAQMLMALNSMRLNPDPGVSRMALNQIDQSSNMKMLEQQGNMTADALERAGFIKEAEAVRMNPRLAPEAAKLLFQKPEDGMTDAMRTKEAQVARLVADGMNEEKARRQIYGVDEPTPAGRLTPEQMAAANQLRAPLRAELELFEEARRGWENIQTFIEEPGSVRDYALVVAFAKVLDPGSVVREGEVAAIANNGALLGGMEAYLINALNGTGALPDEIRDQIVAMSRDMHTKRMKEAQGIYQTYKDTADAYGLDMKHVYSGKPFELPGAPPQTDLPLRSAAGAPPLRSAANPLDMNMPYSREEIMEEARRRGLQR